MPGKSFYDSRGEYTPAHFFVPTNSQLRAQKKTGRRVKQFAPPRGV